MYISDSVKYVGVNDRTLDLFENQYVLEHGMAYNSYLIMDEKIALMDTVDARGIEEWSKHVEEALDGRSPDYIVVQHMEPDHSGALAYAAEKYPNATIVGTAKAFAFMNQFFDIDIADRKLEVKEGDTLSLGKHTLTFMMAPMVHWPEVMVTYESSEKLLFSADGFGKFGTLDADEDWACEARRYYFNIVGKYGAAVQTLLKKASGLEIDKILPLHGPILDDNLGYYIDLYDKWSSYTPENKGVFIAYASIHGNTRKAAEALADKIRNLGEEKVVLSDLSQEDIAECVEDAFRYDRMILCAATYDGNAFVPMEDFLHHLQIKAYQNRTVGLLENGTWAPIAAKAMRTYLESMKNITILDEVVSIKSALKPENEAAMDKLAQAIVNAGA
jgi:flavorubredoxin